MDLCEITSLTMTAWSSFCLGNIYCERKDYKKAQNYFETGILFLKKGKLMPSWMRAIKICVDKTKLMQGDLKMDLKSLYTYAYENRFKSYDGWLSRFLCEILMNMDDDHKSEAEDWIKRSIELDEKRGLRWNLAKDYTVYSDLFKKNRDSVKAKENLSKAIDIFKQCGAAGWVENYEKELTAL